MTDFSTFSLYFATEAQVLEHRVRCSEQPEWAGGLNLKEYLERDRLLDYDEHANNGKLITWVLAPRDDPTTTDFVCSCETYRREGFVVRASTNGNKEMQDVICYAIAGIYTPPSKRGHGHGGHMMRLLHWILAPRSSLPTEFPAEWGAPPESPLQDAAFSVIYSDVKVGCKFYEDKCGPVAGKGLGWVTRGVESTRWRVDPYETNGFVVENRKWKWLSKEEVEPVWEHDIQFMKADALAAVSNNTTILSFLPDKGVAQFLIQWQMSFTPDMQPIYPLSTWGVQLVGGEDAASEPPTYATWILGPGSPPSLSLTRFRATKEMFPKLLRKVMDAARKQGAGAVETWNLPDELKDAALDMGGETYEREAQLPVVKWYGPEPNEKVVWGFNERFSWI